MALAVMTFVSLVVVALLSLVLATLLANRNVGQINRYTRAADGALEMAVDNIRMDSTRALGQRTTIAGDPNRCNNGPGSYTMANGTRPADAVTVAVTCTVDPTFAPTPVPAAGYQASQGSLLVVGESYNGDINWTTNCPTSGAGSAGPGCFPWTAALGAARYPSQSKAAIDSFPATLVHSGPAALAFASNVLVKQGAVALRNSGTSSSLGSPAVLVGGTYAQGSKGLIPSVTCGLLAKDHPWSVQAARLADLGNTKSCDDPSAKALDVDDGLSAPTGAWSPAVVRGLARSAPSCGASPISLDPGSYNQAETAKLNTLFLNSGAGGACTGKTFWFKPGDYWFDAGGTDSALAFKDPTSNYVFGVRNGAGTACDPAQSGVSITLSARSGIRHTGGNVSICPKLSTGPTGTTASTAIYQSGEADNGWIATAAAVTTTATAGTQVLLIGGTRSTQVPAPTVTNVDNARLADGSVATASFKCVQPSRALIGSDYISALAAAHNCGGSATMSFTGWGVSGGAAPAPIPITSAEVVVTGTSSHANAAFAGTSDGLGSPSLLPSQTVIDVTPKGSPTTCSVTYSQINRSGATNSAAYELLDDTRNTGRAGQPACSTLLTDRVSLYDATIVVTQYVNADCSYVLFDPLTLLNPFLPPNSGQLDSLSTQFACPGDSYGFSLDSAQLRTSSVVAPGTSVVTPAYDNTYGYSYSGVQACSAFPCPIVSKAMTLSAFDNSSAPYVPTGSNISSATALVTGSSGNANGSGSGLDLVLTIPSVGSCSISSTGLPGARLGRVSGEPSQTASIDLFSSASCRTLLSGVDAAVLRTSSLLLTAKLSCESLCVVGRNFDLIIDRVELSTTSTSSYNHPVRSMLFTEKDASTQLTVAGGISLSRATIDLAWRGTAPVAPILGGTSVIGALGSDMSPTAKMGVVCCTPSTDADRLVRLDAKVNGKVRASAVVRFIDTSNGGVVPGKGLEVRDWHYCTDSKCSNG